MNQHELKKKYNITSWNELGLNYWGLPKCMNTSIKYSLHKKLNPDEARDTGGTAVWVHHPDLIPYISKDQALSNGNVNFTVVRHPYPRILSLYRDLMFHRKNLRLNGIDFNRLKTLDDFLDACIRNSTDDDDIHFRSMAYFICKNDKPLFDNVLSFEEVGPFLNMDLAHINVTNPVPVELTSGQKQIIKTRYANDFEIFKFDDTV